MPEGPEVRTIADELAQVLTGSYIQNIDLFDRAKQVNLEKVPRNSRIFSVSSYGKKLIFWLGNNPQSNSNSILVTSLGMTGKWSFVKGNHSHICLQIGKGEKKDNSILSVITHVFDLWYDDFRYIGNVTYINNPASFDQYFINIGFDILGGVMPQDMWLSIFKISSFKNTRICAFLLMQDYIAGIGNYLKSEILYVARIKPDRSVSSLSLEEIETLRIVSHQIIREAYSYGGLTIETYWSPNGKEGRYPKKVYKRDVDVNGFTVIPAKYTKSDRTTYWVPELQH
jgi:endonuclease-8